MRGLEFSITPSSRVSCPTGSWEAGNLKASSVQGANVRGNATHQVYNPQAVVGRRSIQPNSDVRVSLIPFVILTSHRPRTALSCPSQVALPGAGDKAPHEGIGRQDALPKSSSRKEPAHTFSTPTHSVPGVSGRLRSETWMKGGRVQL